MIRVAFILVLAGYIFADKLASMWEGVGDNPSTSGSSLVSSTSACDIKDNISMNTDERIYHLAGQEHYDETIITPSKGERWFCTEDAARSAGWRKAHR